MKRSISFAFFFLLLTGAAAAAAAAEWRRKPLRLTKKRSGGGSGGESKKSVAASGSGASSFTASVFNLVNNVAGAGILALSAGQAKGTGWIPSIGICGLLGIISARTFAMIGEACELTGEEDFKGLWSCTMGANSTYLVDSMIALLCFSVSVIYSGILGDLLTSLLTQFGVTAGGSRTRNLLLVTATCLWPMSLIKNLSALAFTSILGFCAILYTVIFISFRALDGSYSTALNSAPGKFVTESLPFMPSFAKSTWWNIDFSSLVLASNLGLAYIAHYNGPAFYRNLKDTSAERFSNMVQTSFWVLIVLYSITMAAGYSTFGDACQGNILLNYHPDDVLSTLGRFATLASILFGFPMVATGAREGLVGAASSFGVEWLKEHHFAVVTGMLLCITAIACTVQDVSLVVGLTGAAMGSFIVYICPALIYTNAVRQVKGVGSPEDVRARRYLALVPFGILIGCLGVFMTLTQ